MVLRGADHVGKSRTLQRIVASMSGTSRSRVVTANPTMSQVPLGVLSAVIHQLPLEAMAQVQLAELAYREFLPDGPNHGMVLGVDDAENLDPASVTVLARVIRGGLATVVLVWPHDLDLPPWLSELIERSVLTVRTVDPLTPEQVASWVHTRWPDVSKQAIDRLSRLTNGNPWVLEQLCSPDDGNLVRRGGRLELANDLTLSSALGDEIDGQLDTLGRLSRRAFDVVAVVGEVEWSILAELATSLLIDQLEQAGFVEVAERDRRTYVRPCDELVAHRAAQQTSVSRRRRIVAAVIEQVTAHGSRRQTDALRVATWSARAGVAVEAEVMANAARHAVAVGASQLAGDLARRSVDAGSARGAVALAAALIATRDFSAAHEAIAAALDGEQSDDDRAAMTRLRCDLAFAESHGFLDAIVACDRSAERIHDPRLREHVRFQRERCRAALGSTEALFASTESALEGETGMDRMLRLVARSEAAWRAGRYADALDATAAAMAAEPHRGSTVVGHGARLIRAESFVATGRIGDALSVAIASHTRSHEVTGSPLAPSWMSVIGWLWTLRGDRRRGIAELERALPMLDEHDPMMVRTRAVARLAIALAECGQTERASRVLDRSGLEDCESVHDRALLEGARAWAGRVAPSELCLTAASLVTLDHAHAASHLADHALRLRMPAHEVVDAVSSADLPEGPVARVRRDRALALDRFDAPALLAVADRFVALERCADAIETTALAMGLMSQGDPDFVLVRARLDLLRSRCPLLDTPLLASHEPLLTARQIEIAERAPTSTSSEIANELSISVRTVNNHLQAVFAALRVHDRGALGRVLNLTDERRTIEPNVL